MKKEPALFREFKESFKDDYGVVLSERRAKRATENLVNFFDLLWQFDQEDKQNLMKMEGSKNE